MTRNLRSEVRGIPKTIGYLITFLLNYIAACFIVDDGYVKPFLYAVLLLIWIAAMDFIMKARKKKRPVS